MISFFYGIISVWPILNTSEVKLLIILIWFILTPNLLAIDQRLSPFWTTYKFEVLLSLMLSLLFVVGNVRTWPIVNMSFVKLFSSLKRSTEIPYSLAIEYSESPLCTTYVFSSISSPVLSTSPGISRTWPTVNISLVKLFNFIMALGVVLYLLAIEYKVSSFFTMYVVLKLGLTVIVPEFGIWRIWPTYIVFPTKSFRFTSSSIVVLFELAILHKLSPFCTTYVMLVWSDGATPGITKLWPTLIRFVVKLLADFISFTPTLNLLAIDQRLSPFCTI